MECGGGFSAAGHSDIQTPRERARDEEINRRESKDRDIEEGGDWGRTLISRTPAVTPMYRPRRVEIVELDLLSICN